jgi:hypothetical protein
MKFVAAVLCVMGFVNYGFAEETHVEKAEVRMDSAKRGMKKGMNRTKEAVCGELTGDSKIECLAKKGKHRAEEGDEAVKDKASEFKNNVDTDIK